MDFYENTMKIQQNTSMTRSVDSAIRLLFFRSKSWAITGFVPVASWAVQTKDAKAEKNLPCLEFPPKKTTKIENEFHSSKPAKQGVSPFFWGVRQTNRSHGKTPTSNKLLGSFQLPLGDLRFVEGFQDSHWRPSWNPETGCFNVAETCVLVEYKGKDALVSNNCLKKEQTIASSLASVHDFSNTSPQFQHFIFSIIFREPSAFRSAIFIYGSSSQMMHPPQF